MYFYLLFTCFLSQPLSLYCKQPSYFCPDRAHFHSRQRSQLSWKIKQPIVTLASHTTEIVNKMHRSSQETECETDSGCEDCQGGSGTQRGGRVYREEAIPGKGIGCIASKELPAGSLVIREVPALYVTPDLDGHAETIRAFAEMEPQDQRELLRLFNLYSKPESEWSASMLKELKDCEEDAGGDLDSISEVSRETALQVWQVWLTNAYDNGVFLKLSRFNHSCRPNTEYFWNTDLEV